MLPLHGHEHQCQLHCNVTKYVDVQTLLNTQAWNSNFGLTVKAQTLDNARLASTA